MIQFTNAETNALVMMLILAIICLVVVGLASWYEWHYQNPKVGGKRLTWRQHQKRIRSDWDW